MSFLYDKSLKNFLEAKINWGIGSGGDTIRIQLIKENEYPTSGTLADAKINHEFFSSIPPEARVGNPQTLSDKNTTLGAASSGDAVMTQIGTSDGSIKIVGYVLYKSTGTDSTSALIAYINEPFKNVGGTVVPLATNSGSITIVLSNATPSLNYIFKL